MRTKEEICEAAIDIIKKTSEASDDALIIFDALNLINVSLLDIRDILENRLQDIAEPIKHIANNNGGNF